MTNYFSFQHFRKMNVRFMLLKKIPLCMKLSVIMLFICVGLAYASDSYSQNVLLNIDVNNKSVQEVLDEIEKQSDFHFFYNNKQVNTSRIVSIKSKQKNVFNVLEQLFSGTNISYKVLDKSIILSPKEVLVAQQKDHRSCHRWKRRTCSRRQCHSKRDNERNNFRYRWKIQFRSTR